MSVPLTASRGPVDFTPLALIDREPPIVIKVRVPTPYERDAYASALVRGGVVHYSKQQIRDLMLAGVVAMYPEEKFDDIRSDLTELWACGDEEQRVRRLQQERLAELLDVPEGTDPPDNKELEVELEKIVPEVTMDAQKRVRVVAVQQHVTSTYEPLQKAFADLAEQEAKRAWLQAETYVTGWSGLEHEPDGNGRGGLKKHEVEYLRSQLGSDAWLDLSDFITALHGIDGDEEKNLDSLLESMSNQNGSTAKVSKPSGESGDSTDAPISPIPESESAPTTGPSSSSTSSSAKKTGASKTGRTGRASSSSQ
jgi:hypothetical protein